MIRKGQIYYPIIEAKAKAKEKKYLNRIFAQSKPLLRRLPVKSNALISFSQLKSLAQKTAKKNRSLRWRLKPTLEWLGYIQHRSNRLKNLFDFPYLWQAALEPVSFRYVRMGGARVTDFQASMFRHCDSHFYRQRGIHLKLTSGFRSPAYQLYMTGFMRGSLEQIFEKAAPPFYSRHQKPEPDLSIGIQAQGLSKIQEERQLSQINGLCRGFGLESTFPGQVALRHEFSATPQGEYYQAFAWSNSLPEGFWPDLYQGMEISHFYPSRSGLKVILAMAGKESSWQWNPGLAKTKKKLIRKTFLEALKHLEEGAGQKLAGMLMDRSKQKQLRALKKELLQLTSLGNRGVTEYDFYQWSRKFYGFMLGMERQFKGFAKLGGLVWDYKARLDKIRFEPQTFGLWQNNVNHLVEILQADRKWRQQYGKVFKKGKVQRHGLVQALSGLDSAPLGRPQTLGLILQAWTAPHYWGHLRGERDDWAYYASENLAGKLSTYKAAFQGELNRRTKGKLTADGDLNHSLPYSLQPDWNRLSNSQRVMISYMRGHGLPRKSQESWMRELIRAQDAKALLGSRLYKKVMGKKAGRRSYPQIQSDLYQQTPKSYAAKVVKLAKRL